MKTFCLITFVLVKSFAIAQLNQWVTLSYTDQVNAITENCNFLWISTDDGILFYNNDDHSSGFYNHCNTTILSDDISDIAINNNGEKIITTAAGIYKMDGEIVKKLNTTIPYYYNTNNGFINTVECDFNNDIWYLGSNSKLHQYHSAIDSSISPAIIAEKNVYAMSSDVSQNIYIVFEEGDGLLLYSYDGIILKKISEVEVIPFENKSISSMYIDTQHRIWLTTSHDSQFGPEVSYDHEGGISMYENGVWTHFNSSDFPVYYSGFDFITQSPDGTYYAGGGTYYNHLISFHFNPVTNLPEDVTLVDNGISSNLVYIDSEGAQWFLEDNTLIKYDGSAATIRQGEVPAESVALSTMDLQNRFWTANATELLHQIDALSWDIFNASNCAVYNNFTLPTPVFNDLHVGENNELYVSANHGLYHYDGLDWIAYLNDEIGLSEPDEEILKCRVDQENHIWALTRYSLFKFDGTGWFDMSPTAFTFHEDFEIFDDTAYVVSTSGKLYWYRNDVWTSISSPASELPSSPGISSIVRDSDLNIWLAGSTGLYKLASGEITKESSISMKTLVIDTVADAKWFINDEGNALFKYIDSITVFAYDMENSDFRSTTHLYMDRQNNMIMDDMKIFNERGVNGFDETNSFPFNLPVALCKQVETRSDDLYVYPNPAHDILHFGFPVTENPEFEIHIYTTTGQHVYSWYAVISPTDYTYSFIDISSLQRGMYFIEVLNGSNQVVNKFYKY